MLRHLQEEALEISVRRWTEFRACAPEGHPEVQVVHVRPAEARVAARACSSEHDAYQVMHWVDHCKISRSSGNGRFRTSQGRSRRPHVTALPRDVSIALFFFAIRFPHVLSIAPPPREGVRLCRDVRRRGSLWRSACRFLGSVVLSPLRRRLCAAWACADVAQGENNEDIYSF